MAKYVNTHMALHVNYAELQAHIREFRDYLTHEIRPGLSNFNDGLDDDERLAADELDELAEAIDRLDDAVSEAAGALDNDGTDAVDALSNYV